MLVFSGNGRIMKGEIATVSGTLVFRLCQIRTLIILSDARSWSALKVLDARALERKVLLNHF
eukprot:TRINITY_DN9105_c0_g1_i1.p2 TRINITY_DN9105_c0_g1~~TRINITY_DN9105_c0_g1_i1.p2  ORF type:complete len:62 (-),score=4.28 TRINITY_DN9105_c0_g1_i1:85-270(-)